MTDLEQRLYAAFLAAARDLGPDLKTLSWFGRNHRRCNLLRPEPVGEISGTTEPA